MKYEFIHKFPWKLHVENNISRKTESINLNNV